MSGDWMRKDKQSRTVLLYSPLLAKNQQSTCPTLQASTDIPPTIIQWNPFKKATIVEWHFGPHREVAIRKESCFFCCLHAIVTYPTCTSSCHSECAQLSSQQKVETTFMMDQDCNCTEHPTYHTESLTICIMHVAL